MKIEPKDGDITKKTGVSNKCEVANIWEVLGKRWSLIILKNLSTKEVIRFNELKKVLSGISEHCIIRKTIRTRT